MTITSITHGRRRAEIHGNHVALFIVENKRKGERNVRGGEGMLTRAEDAWKVALLWTQKAIIGFEDKHLEGKS